MIIRVPHKLPIMMFSMSGPYYKIDNNFAYHHVRDETLKLVSISSINQMNDIFTKAYPLSRIQDLMSKLKMISALPS